MAIYFFVLSFMISDKYFYLPIYSTGALKKIKIKQKLEKKKSDFQEIQIIETEKFGKCLIIDEIIQTSEKDHQLYDREILRLLNKKDKNILILGGGDGYVAEEINHQSPKAKVIVIDLDVEVVNSCKKTLAQKVFDKPNVNLYIGDAYFYLKAHSKEIKHKFDGIVCDLTDVPIGRRNKKEFERFFQKIIFYSYKVLKEDGWIGIQAGASTTNGYYIDMVSIIRKILEKKFREIIRSDVYIPSYGEKCAFLFGKK